MGKLLTAIINTLFPPRPQEALLQNVSFADINALYRPGKCGDITYLAHYDNPIIQACVVENKFQHSRRAAKLLGNLLQQWAVQEDKKTLLIPIPLGKERERTRLHNQSMSIIKQAGPNVHISNTVLKRQKETPPQTQLNRAERIKNIKGAFICNDKAFDWSDYEQVVIVDDVVTTGATLKSAKDALLPYIPTHILIRTLAIAH